MNSETRATLPGVDAVRFEFLEAFCGRLCQFLETMDIASIAKGYDVVL